MPPLLTSSRPAAKVAFCVNEKNGCLYATDSVSQYRKLFPEFEYAQVVSRYSRVSVATQPLHPSVEAEIREAPQGILDGRTVQSSQ